MPKTVAHLIGVVSMRQVDEKHHARVSIHECADCRSTAPSDYQVALPVPDPGPGIDDQRTLVDQHGRDSVARSAYLPGDDVCATICLCAGAS